jgi:hypothetical protein
MNLTNRLTRLEETAEKLRPSLFKMYDLKSLTNDELLALRACYTDDGRPMPERLTPELITALGRVRR